MSDRLQPHRLAAQLEKLAAALRAGGDRAVQIAYDHHTALSSSNGGRGGKGGHSDPTGTAAFRLHPSSRWYDQLNTDGAQLLNTSDRMLKTLAAALTGQPEGRPAAVTWCANPHGCPDDAPAEPGRRGRCYACWRFWRNHDRDRVVRNDRTPDKVHVHPVTGDILD